MFIKILVRRGNTYVLNWQTFRFIYYRRTFSSFFMSFDVNLKESMEWHNFKITLLNENCWLTSTNVGRCRYFDINDVRFWTAIDGKCINWWYDLNVFDLFDRMKRNIKIKFVLIEHTKAHSSALNIFVT